MIENVDPDGISNESVLHCLSHYIPFRFQPLIIFINSTNYINTSMPKCHHQYPNNNEPADILSLLPVKSEDMLDITTKKIKLNHAIIKTFQNIIQDQSMTMTITICNHIIGFLVIVI